MQSKRAVIMNQSGTESYAGKNFSILEGKNRLFATQMQRKLDTMVSKRVDKYNFSKKCRSSFLSFMD